MSIKGKIFKIIPVSVYQEKVYTQDAIIELSNGSKIAVSDPSKYCKNDDIGRIKDFDIKIILASSTEKVDGCVVSIVSSYMEKEPYRGPTADICGRVEQIAESGSSNIEQSYFVLDVGAGTLKLIYKDIRGLNLLEKNIDALALKLSGLEKCNYIRIKGATLYLEGIE